VPSVVALRRPRAVAVAKVTTVSGLAQGLNETFSNSSPFLELLILERLRFTNFWRLGCLRDRVLILPHYAPPTWLCSPELRVPLLTRTERSTA
jgi:hypothetical protein